MSDQKKGLPWPALIAAVIAIAAALWFFNQGSGDAPADPPAAEAPATP